MIRAKAVGADCNANRREVNSPEDALRGGPLPIFRNAGTIVERILERELQGCVAKLHGPTPDDTLDADAPANVSPSDAGRRGTQTTADSALGMRGFGGEGLYEELGQLNHLDILLDERAKE